MARKEKKYHFIYKTTNLLSGRYYIGMHSTDNLYDGYLGSGNRLRRAIKKHGEENFKREILEFCENRQELSLRESEVVNLDEIAKEECMNLVVGGQGGLTGLSNDKIKLIRDGASKYQKLKWLDDDYRNKMLKLAVDGVKKAHKKGKYKYNTFNGKKHTEETKKKISESKKGKGKGNKNSQYGTCWITKDGVNKKIKQDELETHISQGWEKGRKLK